MAKTTKTTKTTKQYRPPIVALLGHVDHGKTTILDSIKKSAIAEGEEGGITQGIAAYTVTHDGKDITFVDTPGHEAFDLMRSRGGMVADVVLLIVAADDSVKPQTKESIGIIKNLGRPCIIVINKVDISGVNVEKVKRDLVAEELVPESMGGQVPVVEVSGKTGKGIPDLLEMIQLVSEMSKVGHRAPAKGSGGEAVVLESYKDTRLGYVASVVVTAGEFRKGSYMKYRDESGENWISEKIRGFISDTGEQRDVVMEGYGARVLGLKNVVPLGKQMYCVEEPKVDIETAPVPQKQTEPVSDDQTDTPVEDSTETADSDLLSMLIATQEAEGESEKNELNVIVKANARGTLDAIRKSLEPSIKERLISIIHADVGDITVSDIERAESVKAIVIGFRVGIDPVADTMAKKSRILAKVYQIIYELVDEIEEAAAALQLPDESEVQMGSAEVRKLFVLSNGSKVLGLRVQSGELKHGGKCRIVRNGEAVAEGKILSMKCEKEQIQTAGKGTDCGVVMDASSDVEEGDVLECYRIVKR
ncbi:MAG: GTP-binding protein [Candidatus Dojkabacteria bacterium]|nr:GTP-binding protein [Candidatus Dojkabacteria bacterium]